MDSIALKLTEGQLKKISAAHKKNDSVTIQLKYDQIGAGTNKFKLNKTELTKLKRAKTSGTGARLTLSHDQIKSGGFLPLLLAGIGALGSLIGGASTIANTV